MRELPRTQVGLRDMVENKHLFRMFARNARAVGELVGSDDEIERQAGRLEGCESPTDGFTRQPVDVGIDVRKMACSGELRTVRERLRCLDCATDIRILEIEPAHDGTDRFGEARPEQVARLPSGVTGLHDHSARNPVSGQHVAEVIEPEVTVDGLHRLGVDPVLWGALALPEVNVRVDDTGRSQRHQSRCQTRVPSNQSVPSGAPGTATWQGSVWVHHSRDTGSASMRRRSAS